MKIQTWRVFCVLIALVAPLVLRADPKGPPTTRASQLGPLATGMAGLFNMQQFLREYPGSHTAILDYLQMDGADVNALASNLRNQAPMQEKAGREFWPQVALETSRLSLSEFRRELSQPGSLLDNNIRAMARLIAAYRDKRKWFFIRPFSEMNDGTDGNPWEFGNKSYSNTPQDLAAAWKLLRETFDQEGATNAIFIFSPLAAYRVHRESEVLTALNLIPPGYIDAFGVNVYSRPMTAYGGSSPEPISFAALAEPWLQVLARSRHRGIPLAVPEMAVSRQASDAQRATWLRSAFKFARSHGFVMVTYFNYPHPYWEVDDGSLAGVALRAELGGVRLPSIASASGLPGDSHPAVATGPEAEIAKNWQLVAMSNPPASIRPTARTWKALALVYPQREVASGSDPGAPPLLLDMPRDQIVAALEALRNWPAYVANVTDGAVHIDLTIAMSRRPLRLPTSAQGALIPLGPKDVGRDLASFRKLARFDSVETVWYAGTNAATGGTSDSANGTDGAWADVALGGTTDRSAFSRIPDRSNVFVARWLQGVIAYVRSLGYACPAFEDAGRYGYGKDPERWVHDLMRGSVPTEGRQDGLSSTL